MEHHYFIKHNIKENIFLIFFHFTRKLHVNCDRYEYFFNKKNLKNKKFMILSLHKVYTLHVNY